MIPALHSHEELPFANWMTRFAIAIVIAGAFALISHDWSISRTYVIENQTQFHKQPNRIAIRQKTTTGSSAMGYLLIGAAGACCVLLRPLGRLRWDHPLTLACLLYIGWCVLSVLWSPSMGVSFRKVTIFVLLLTGTFGMARKIELEDLCWIIVIICSIFLVLGFLAEIAHGTFRPWIGSYRFAGTLHPNSQGMHAAVLCLAAGFLSWSKRDYPWIRWAFMGLGVIALLLSESRTSLAALLVTGSVAWILRARGPQRILLVAGTVSLACIVAIAYGFVSTSTVHSTADVVTMGRQESISSLTGRIPLWQELLKAAEDRPFWGYGFGGFWSEKNIRKYSEMFAWQIPHAHNAYLDIVLSTGIIGLVLYLGWALSTLLVAVARHEQSQRPAELFAICLIVFSLAHGAGESKFPFTGMGSLFLFFAMVLLAIRPPSPHRGTLASAENDSSQ